MSTSIRHPRRPKYLAARDALLDLLRAGTYRVGDALPAIPALAEGLGWGQSPVFRAVRMLADEGFLRTVPGSGCYVARLPYAQEGNPPATEPRADAANRTPPAEESLRGSVDSGMRVVRKRLRMAVLGDLSLYSGAWRRIADDFMASHGDVAVELVPVGGASAGTGDDLWREADVFQVALQYLPCFAEQGCLFDPTLAGGLGVDTAAFAPGLIRAATHRDRLWGVPLTTAVEIFYGNATRPELLEPLERAGGYWDFLARVEETARALPEAGFEVGLSNNRSLFSHYLAAVPDAPQAWEELRDFSRPALADFLERLEPFFRAPWMRHHGMEGTGDDTWDYFGRQRSLLACGTNLRVRQFAEADAFPWRVLPTPLEPGAAVQGACNLNVVSDATAHPLECLDWLRYLARESTQRVLAGEGTLVAHLAANAAYRQPGLDAVSRERLLASLGRVRVPTASVLDATEMTVTVINNALLAWCRGQCAARELADDLNRRIYFYERARSLRRRDTSTAPVAGGGMEAGGAMHG